MEHEETTILSGLRPLRLKKQLSQEYLSQQLGLTRQALQRYETSGTLPRTPVLLGLCRILKCEIWELFHPHPERVRERLP